MTDDNGMLNFESMKETEETFNIDDRSSENEQRAIKELGPDHKAAIKNAKAVLKYADADYQKSLEKSGLGNYPPLIKELNKLGHELEKKYKEANRPSSMRTAMLKAFQNNAREKINKTIFKFESEYATENGGISKI